MSPIKGSEKEMYKVYVITFRISVYVWYPSIIHEPSCRLQLVATFTASTPGPPSLVFSYLVKSLSW